MKAPGSFSLRAIEILRSLGQEEAQKVATLASVTLSGGFVYRDTTILAAAVGPPMPFILAMQELGIAAGVEAGFVGTILSGVEGRFSALLTCHNHGLLVTHSDPSLKLEVLTYQITAVGVQILRLVNSEANLAYLRACGVAMRAQGFDVSVCSVAPLPHGQLRFEAIEQL